MKKYLLVLLVVMIASPVWAANRTLIRRGNALNRPQTPASAEKKPVPGYVDRSKWNEDGELVNREFEHSMFAAPALKFSTLHEEFGLLAGGRFGWVVNHRYVLGLGGYGVVNDIEVSDPDSNTRPDVMMSYGGAELEYVVQPAALVHFSFSTLVGLGLVEYDYRASDGDDTFWVIEPAAHVWLNVTPFFRTGLGAGYRMATGVDLEGLDDGDLSGFALTLTLKFGSF